MLGEVAARCVKGDSRRVGNVERLDGARHIEPCKCGDSLPRFLAQAFAFGTEDKGEALAGKCLLDGFGSFRIEPTRREAESMEFFDGVGEMAVTEIT